MTEKTNLGAMLRTHILFDPEIPMYLGPVLTETLMKASDLRADFAAVAEGKKQAVFLAPELYADMTGVPADLKETAVACAKALSERANSLIHRDLSTEQIQVEGEDVEISFSEEVFCGPFGYDTAALMVSAFMGWIHTNALEEAAFTKDDFCDCCLDLVSNLADQFIWNYDSLFEELADTEVAKGEGFKREYFEAMMPDLAASAGLEALRILSGDRSSLELSEITDPAKREEAEQIILQFAKICLEERDSFYFGADFAAVIERAGRAVKGC